MNEFIGQPLTELLHTRMRSADMSLTQLAKQLHVGHSYLSQLVRGVKPISSVSDLFLRACAEFLDKPVVLIYLLAGRLQSQDFFTSPMTFSSRIDSALEQIANSSIASEACISTETLIGLPDSAKLLLVLLYERAESVLLLPPRVSWGEVSALGQSTVPFEVRLNKPR